MELTAGTLVTANVRLVSLLGEGGMGCVWTADHLSLKTRVAVKFISAELIKEDSSIAERFNREAALSAQIRNPHVVQTFDHGVMDDGRPYIVMELLEGESLQDRLDRHKWLSLDVTKLVMVQAAKALRKAHKMGIVHRDIKPDNLFLTEEDDELFLKVLDFGIAKQTGTPQTLSVTQTGTMIGTPEYMSPEQVLSAKSVDFKSDLWALGVVAYHCVTGAVPFSGETLGSLCVAIASAVFAPPSSLRPELPAALDSWFAKALAPDPEDRFGSAKEMASSFVLAVSGQTSASLNHPGLSTADWSGGHQVVDPATVNTAMQVSPALAEQGAAPAVTGHGAAEPKRTTPTFTGTSVGATPPNKSRRLAAVAIGLGAIVIAAGAAVALRANDTAKDLTAPSAAAAGPGSVAATTSASAAAEPTTTASAGSNSVSLPSVSLPSVSLPSASLPSASSTSASSTNANTGWPRIGRPQVSPTPTVSKTKTTSRANATTTPTTKDRGF